MATPRKNKLLGLLRRDAKHTKTSSKDTVRSSTATYQQGDVIFRRSASYSDVSPSETVQSLPAPSISTTAVIPVPAAAAAASRPVKPPPPDKPVRRKQNAPAVPSSVTGSVGSINSVSSSGRTVDQPLERPVSAMAVPDASLSSVNATQVRPRGVVTSSHQWRSEEHLAAVGNVEERSSGRKDEVGKSSAPPVDLQRTGLPGDITDSDKKDTPIAPPRAKRKAPVPPQQLNNSSSSNGPVYAAVSRDHPSDDVTSTDAVRPPKESRPCRFVAPPPPDTPPPPGREGSRDAGMDSVESGSEQDKVNLTTQVNVTKRDSLASDCSQYTCSDDEVSQSSDVNSILAAFDDVTANDGLAAGDVEFCELTCRSVVSEMSDMTSRHTSTTSSSAADHITAASGGGRDDVTDDVDQTRSGWSAAQPDTDVTSESDRRYSASGISALDVGAVAYQDYADEKTSIPVPVVTARRSISSDFREDVESPATASSSEARTSRDPAQPPTAEDDVTTRTTTSGGGGGGWYSFYASRVEPEGACADEDGPSFDVRPRQSDSVAARDDEKGAKLPFKQEDRRIIDQKMADVDSEDDDVDARNTVALKRRCDDVTVAFESSERRRRADAADNEDDWESNNSHQLQTTLASYGYHDDAQQRQRQHYVKNGGAGATGKTNVDVEGLAPTASTRQLTVTGVTVGRSCAIEVRDDLSQSSDQSNAKVDAEESDAEQVDEVDVGRVVVPLPRHKHIVNVESATESQQSSHTVDAEFQHRRGRSPVQDLITQTASSQQRDSVSTDDAGSFQHRSDKNDSDVYDVSDEEISAGADIVQEAHRRHDDVTWSDDVTDDGDFVVVVPAVKRLPATTKITMDDDVTKPRQLEPEVVRSSDDSVEQFNGGGTRRDQTEDSLFRSEVSEKVNNVARFPVAVSVGSDRRDEDDFSSDEERVVLPAPKRLDSESHLAEVAQQRRLDSTGFSEVRRDVTPKSVSAGLDDSFSEVIHGQVVDFLSKFDGKKAPEVLDSSSDEDDRQDAENGGETPRDGSSMAADSDQEEEQEDDGNTSYSADTPGNKFYFGINADHVTENWNQKEEEQEGHFYYNQQQQQQPDNNSSDAEEDEILIEMATPSRSIVTSRVDVKAQQRPQTGSAGNEPLVTSSTRDNISTAPRHVTRLIIGDDDFVKKPEVTSDQSAEGGNGRRVAEARSVDDVMRSRVTPQEINSRPHVDEPPRHVNDTSIDDDVTQSTSGFSQITIRSSRVVVGRLIDNLRAGNSPNAHQLPSPPLTDRTSTSSDLDESQRRMSSSETASTRSSQTMVTERRSMPLDEVERRRPSLAGSASSRDDVNESENVEVKLISASDLARRFEMMSASTSRGDVISRSAAQSSDDDLDSSRQRKTSAGTGNGYVAPSAGRRDQRDVWTTSPRTSAETVSSGKQRTRGGPASPAPAATPIGLQFVQKPRQVVLVEMSSNGGENDVGENVASVASKPTAASSKTDPVPDSTDVRRRSRTSRDETSEVAVTPQNVQKAPSSKVAATSVPDKEENFWTTDVRIRHSVASTRPSIEDFASSEPRKSSTVTSSKAVFENVANHNNSASKKLTTDNPTSRPAVELVNKSAFALHHSGTMERTTSTQKVAPAVSDNGQKSTAVRQHYHASTLPSATAVRTERATSKTVTATAATPVQPEVEFRKPTALTASTVTRSVVQPSSSAATTPSKIDVVREEATTTGRPARVATTTPSRTVAPTAAATAADEEIGEEEFAAKLARLKANLRPNSGRPSSTSMRFTADSTR